MSLANPSGFLFAYTFGNISPNSKTMDVITPTSSKNLSHGCSIKSKRRGVKVANTKTVAILMRLLSNKIIANSLLGFLRK